MQEMVFVGAAEQGWEAAGSFARFLASETPAFGYPRVWD